MIGSTGGALVGPDVARLHFHLVLHDVVRVHLFHVGLEPLLPLHGGDVAGGELVLDDAVLGDGLRDCLPAVLPLLLVVLDG